MDGEFAQKEKAKEIKREVKRAAARRRGVLPTETLDFMAVEPEQNARLGRLVTGESSLQSASPKSPSFHGESTLGSSGAWAATHTQPRTESTSSTVRQHRRNMIDTWPIATAADEESGDPELDRRFVMLYLDHFFPFLFPFYKPLLLEGGRSWILELIAGNDAMRHTTLCLSTYFVSVALDGAVSGPDVCKTLAWEKLLRQMGVTYRMLQCSLQEVVSSSQQDLIAKTAQTMGSIVQLQRFEISVGNFENCREHLEAAIELFKQVFRTAGDGNACVELPTFDSVLSQMGRPLWSTKSRSSRAWSADQAAFRFYSAMLIMDDIIASTCMEHRPRLLEYHARLLANDHYPDERPPLNLEGFVGCKNWVMLQIGEIATLDEWKKTMRKAGQLDMMELVSRASTIKQILIGNLTHLDMAGISADSSKCSDSFAIYDDQYLRASSGCTVFVTRVWAHAALLYLSVVVSGWQPSSAGIRENVVQTLELLEQIPSPGLLRTLVWPFCMAGCLAERGEECRFRAMADALVPHRLFGAVQKALEIMENAWRCRDELTLDTDLATCVCSLGYVSLLV